MTLTVLDLSQLAAWSGSVAATFLIREVLSRMLALEAILPSRDDRQTGATTPSRDKQLLFTGRAIDSGAVVTEAGLLGAPSTVLLMTAASVLSAERRGPFTAMLAIAWRRSFGRLWVVCRSERADCARAMAALTLPADVCPKSIYYITGNCDSVNPHNSSGDIIIQLSGDGRVITYGYPRSAIEHNATGEDDV